MESGSTQATANAAFGNITYTEAGVYTYTITETTQSGIDGMTYSSETVTLTVTVTAASNGSLSTAASYANSNTEDTTGKTFTNNYTKPSGAATLSVTKKVTGDTTRMNDEEKAQTYSFTLARDDANEKKTETLPSPLTATTSGDATGTNGVAATFGQITYVEEGTYYYTITETTNSGVTGMT